MLSVADTVPAPLVNPVSTFAITGALVSVVALPTLVTSPVKFALVATVVAVVAVAAFPPILKLAAVPVIFVPTKVVGVPNDGEIKVGEVAKTIAPEPDVPLDKSEAVACEPAVIKPLLS